VIVEAEYLEATNRQRISNEEADGCDDFSEFIKTNGFDRRSKRKSVKSEFRFSQFCNVNCTTGSRSRFPLRLIASGNAKRLGIFSGVSDRSDWKQTRAFRDCRFYFNKWGNGPRGSQLKPESDIITSSTTSAIDSESL
jgi:hypothetical protein